MKFRSAKAERDENLRLIGEMIKQNQDQRAKMHNRFTCHRGKRKVHKGDFIAFNKNGTVRKIRKNEKAMGVCIDTHGQHQEFVTVDSNFNSWVTVRE